MQSGSTWLEAAAIGLALLVAAALLSDRPGMVWICQGPPVSRAATSAAAPSRIPADAALHEMLTHD